jgi:hypothetical protein
MIEPGQVLPLFCRVACPTSEQLAGCIFSAHSVGELSVMHILVTGRTTQLTEVIRDYLRAACLLVALQAWHRHVTSVQWKIGLLVQGQREACGLEWCSVMALFTSVIPGRTRELPLVLILVAVDAEWILDLESRLFASRQMTWRAIHFCMGKYQGKTCLCVIGNREGWRRPSLYRVTGLALTSVGPLRKLAIVRIRLVAITAEIMRNGSLEISLRVTLRATNLKVLAQQGKMRGGMIEGAWERRLFPRRRGVARVASLLEDSLVRIHPVTIWAVRKG